MDKYRVYEVMESVDDKYIGEASEARTAVVKKTGKLRFAAIAACAAIILCGTVASAAGLGGFEKVSEFFTNSSLRFQQYDQLPTLTNPADYAVEIENDVHPLTGTAAFTAVSCSEHYFYAAVEYAVEEDVLSAVPEGAKLSFSPIFDSNLSGITVGISPISLDGNILTFMIYEGGTDYLPETMNFTIKDLGYWQGYDFVTVKECKIDMTLEKSEVSVLPAVQSLSTSSFDGIEFNAEISPLGIILTCDYQQWEAKYGENSDTRHSKELGLNYMQFYLKDGTVVGDGQDYSTVYGVFASEGGWVDFNTNTEYFYYGFETPVDLSTIDRITIRGMEFYF